jgi:hypothetical protein
MLQYLSCRQRKQNAGRRLTMTTTTKGNDWDELTDAEAKRHGVETGRNVTVQFPYGFKRGRIVRSYWHPMFDVPRFAMRIAGEWSDGWSADDIAS